MNLDLAFVFLFFFTLYFEIILDFRKFAKLVQNSSHMSVTYLTLMLTIYITVVQYQNQEINTGTILLNKL